MTVSVGFPALFSDRIGGIGSVELEGATIGDVLRALTGRYPALAPLVWQANGTINPVVVVFVNDRQVAPQALESAVSPGDVVTLVPAIEGGGRR